MFKSVDELKNLSFEDCVLAKVCTDKDSVVFTVEALIIKAMNSQNSNCTDSYAKTASVKFENGCIEDLIKCGYRYYDADGKLLKEVEDVSILESEWKELIKSFEGSYLVSVEKEDESFTCEVETVDEDGASSYSYLIKVKAPSIVVTWEKYLNRVQR